MHVKHTLSEGHKVVEDSPHSYCSGGMTYDDGGKVEEPTFWGSVKDALPNATRFDTKDVVNQYEHPLGPEDGTKHADGGTVDSDSAKKKAPPSSPRVPEVNEPKHGGKTLTELEDEAMSGKE